MRWAIVATVFSKDVVSTLRDRRTIIMTFGLPLLLYPLLMIGATRLQNTQRESIADSPSRVVVWGELPPVLDSSLRTYPAVTLVPCDAVLCPPELVAGLSAGTVSMPPRWLDERTRDRLGRARNRPGRQGLARTNSTPAPDPGSDDVTVHPVVRTGADVLATRRVDAVLVAPPDLGWNWGQGREGEVAILFESVSPESAEAQLRLVDRLEQIREEEQTARERAAGLPSGFARIVWTTVTNVASRERRAGFRLGSLLPFLLISLSLLGGLYPAIELTAGEKERGTLQTLLCAPIRPLEVVTAKFLAVWATSLTTAVVNIASLAVTLGQILPAEAVTVDMTALITALAVLVPITFTTSAVFLAVATLARDFKDGQNLLTPVFMAFSLPAGLTVLPSMRLDAWTAFVPILNLALGIKATLSGDADPESLLLVAASSCMYAALAVLAAARLYQQEPVLLGVRHPWSALFQLTTQGGRLTPGVVLGTFGVVLVLQFYGSLWLQSQPLAVMLLVLQIGLMLGPTLAVVVMGRVGPQGALGLSVPRPLAIVGSLLVGLSAWAVVVGFVVRLTPPPDGVTKALEEVLQIRQASIPLWHLLALAAFLPAVCEEMLFRGLMLNGLARWGAPAAIATSSFAFAFAHASIYRLAPTLALGLVLGLVAWRARSTVASVIVHGLHNAVLLGLARRPELGALVGWDTSMPPPWTLVAAAAVLLAIGIALTGSPASRAPESQP